jgi:hypothetical protein
LDLLSYRKKIKPTGSYTPIVTPLPPLPSLPTSLSLPNLACPALLTRTRFKIHALGGAELDDGTLPSRALDLQLRLRGEYSSLETQEALKTWMGIICS